VYAVISFFFFFFLLIPGELSPRRFLEFSGSYLLRFYVFHNTALRSFFWLDGRLSSTLLLSDWRPFLSAPNLRGFSLQKRTMFSTKSFIFLVLLILRLQPPSTQALWVSRGTPQKSVFLTPFAGGMILGFPLYIVHPLCSFLFVAPPIIICSKSCPLL